MIHKFLFIMSLWCISFCVQANIGISPIIVDLIGKEASSEIAVKNFDTKNTTYVEVTPYRLFNPANQYAAKKRVRHPEIDGLVVFPAKLILLPGQTQYVRIIKTAKSLKSDQVYEVDIVPKVATHLLNQKHSSGAALGIRVIIGYGARVTLRPDSPTPSMSVKRNKNELIIKNTGNTLLSITSCTQPTKKAEIPLPAYTLYVGQSIKTKLTQLTPTRIEASFMGKSLGSFYTD